MNMRADAGEIQRALRVMLEPGQVTELRAFAGKKPLCVGYFDTGHLEDLARAAVRLETASGIYFIPNVIQPELLARAVNRTKRAGECEATKDADIARRRWLLVDCDPRRRAGISATDAEHDAALARCEAIREGLRALGWPDPILADSGNGGHLLFRVDLPADDGGLVERILAALSERFTDDRVEVDRSVKNPSRVWKLYGTVARKGDPTPERPHRMARLVTVPDELETVPIALLEALAIPAKVPAAAAPSINSTRPIFTNRAAATDAELREKRIRAEVDSFDPAVEGQGGDRLTFRHCCVLVKEWGLSEDEALGYLLPWNSRCCPPWDEEELREKLRRAKRYGKKAEGTRILEEPKGGPGRHAGASRLEVSAPGGDDCGWPDPPPYMGRSVTPPVDATPVPPDPLQEQRGAAWPFLAKRMTEGGPKLQRWGGNLSKIVRHDPRWGGRLALDEMTQEILYDWQPIREGFPDCVQEEIECVYGASFGIEDIIRKLRAQAETNPVHPVREHLEALPEWDGVERLFFVPQDVLGTTDELAGHYFRCWAIGAVRRIFEPGCKMDVALVFVGKQGKGKSTFWSIMGGEWFSDTPIDLDSKDRFQQLASSWIVELPEIDWQTHSKTAEALKAFLTSRVDHYRPPYSKGVLKVPRSSVCVGSTNRQEFLTDPTGSRRFWPVQVPDEQTINLGALRGIRDQLWAEALHLARRGERHFLPPELEMKREAQAERYTVEDSWEDLVGKALGGLKEDRVKRGDPVSAGFTTAEIMLQMGLPAQQHTRQAISRVRGLMQRLGWESKQNWLNGDRKQRWTPPEG